MSVHGSGIGAKEVAKLLEGPAGAPLQLLVSRPPAPAEPPAAATPPPKVVEKIVYRDPPEPVEKIVYVERPVEKIVHVEKPAKQAPAAPPKIVEKFLDRVVEVPVEVPVEVVREVVREVERTVEVPKALGPSSPRSTPDRTARAERTHEELLYVSGRPRSPPVFVKWEPPTQLFHSARPLDSMPVAAPVYPRAVSPIVAAAVAASPPRLASSPSEARPPSPLPGFTMMQPLSGLQDEETSIRIFNSLHGSGAHGFFGAREQAPVQPFDSFQGPWQHSLQGAREENSIRLVNSSNGTQQYMLQGSQQRLLPPSPSPPQSSYSPVQMGPLYQTGLYDPGQLYPQGPPAQPYSQWQQPSPQFGRVFLS